MIVVWTSGGGLVLVMVVSTSGGGLSKCQGFEKLEVSEYEWQVCLDVNSWGTDSL